jgi:uncharacterized protein YdaU (DUF1376 family)
MHHYQHHIGDYRRDTAHLSLLEHGIYRQLLDMYYLNEQPIPKETQVVFRRLSAKTEHEQNAIETILKEFFLDTPEGWKHTRCDSEIAAYQEKAEKNRINGKSGGRPKKTQVVIDGLSDGNLSGTQNNLNHKPLTNNQYIKPICADAHFDAFWKLYPNVRKVAKKNCLAKWKAKKLDLIAEKILSDVRAKSDTWGEFAPSPLTYLNQERWNDDPSPSSAPRKYL